MATNNEAAPADLEAQVWNAIAAFEQILEAMPDDRSSLETLAHAYTHIGDHTRARDYLVRLARVVLADQDAEAAISLREQLAGYAGDADVDAVLPQLQALGSDAGNSRQDSGAESSPATGEQPKSSLSSATEESRQATEKAGRDRLTFRVADELALAWSLLEEGQLTQEDYSAVAHDLSEMSTAQNDLTISVLHVLEHRAHKNLERIVAHIATRCHAPVVTVGNFSPPREALECLPLDFIVRRGAVVFEFIKDDALVAVMNPFDKRLRHDVAVLTNRHCHFYITLASEFDALTSKIRAGWEDE